MALDRISLRKLLKIIFLTATERRGELRKDIRDDIKREVSGVSSGGDFHAPFWADARHHVFGEVDLHNAVDDRIEVNGRRDNLYPRLRDGFLLWWNERRRWTNSPYLPGTPHFGGFAFPGLPATIKINSVLSVRDALGHERHIYPYFAEKPELTDEAARLGLWFLMRAFPSTSPQAFRILDVIRGRTFSLDRLTLHGNEEEMFRRRYSQALNEWAVLRNEYL